MSAKRKNFLKGKFPNVFYNKPVQKELERLRLFSGHMPACWIIHAFYECYVFADSVYRSKAEFDRLVLNLNDDQFDTLLSMLVLIRKRTQISEDPFKKRIAEYLFELSDTGVRVVKKNLDGMNETQALFRGLITHDDVKHINEQEIASRIFEDSKIRAVKERVNEHSVTEGIRRLKKTIQKYELVWRDYITVYENATEYFGQNWRVLELDFMQFMESDYAKSMYGCVLDPHEK